METIDVKDIPEPIARGLEIVAEMARKLTGTQANGHNRIQLGVRSGTVYGTLSRKELYNVQSLATISLMLSLSVQCWATG